MANIPQAVFTGRIGREPHHHVAIQELQDWAYTGNRLRRSPNVDLGYHAAKAACPSSIRCDAA
jgi:hypothetical protein